METEYEAPDISKTKRYQHARNIVIKLAEKYKGQAVTYRYLTRLVPKESHDVFEDVLRELDGAKVLSWRFDQPAPSAIRF